MLKFIVANDPHFSDISPASRTDDYPEVCFQKMMEVAEACRQISPTAVILTGDIFHFKNAKRNSHRVVTRLIKVFRSMGCPVYSIIGNHDIDGSIEKIEDQPLGVLLESGALRLLTRVSFSDPGNPTVHLVGHNHSYQNPMSFMDDIESDRRDPTSYYIDVVHAGILTEATNLPDMINLHTLWPRGVWNLMLSGHIHADLGVIEDRITGKVFTNVGSLTRGSLAESNLTRLPQYLVLALENGQLDTFPVQLKCARPALEVFNVQDHKDKKEIKQKYESFVHFVTQQMNVSAKNTLEDVINDFFKRMSVAPELQAEVNHYLTRASAE